MQSGPVGCADCAGATSIVPSSILAEADAPLFEDLSHALREGRISSLEAAQLSSGLRRALAAKSYDDFFELLSTRLPGFTPIQLLFAGRPSAQLRALNMLATILEALAVSAVSGTLPATLGPTARVHGQKA